MKGAGHSEVLIVKKPLREGSRTKSVKEFALEYVRKYIRQNKLQPGDRLPSAGDLCNMMGVSLTSLRETLKTLEAQGIVEIINGKGTYLKSAEAANILITVGGDDIDKARQLREVFEVRKALERQIIENVIRYATDEELLRIGHRVDRLMFCYNNGKNTVVEDRLFHAEFSSICHNSLLKQLADSVMDMFDRLCPDNSAFDATYSDTVPDHEKMFKSILRGDLEQALAINDHQVDTVLFRLNNDLFEGLG